MSAKWQPFYLSLDVLTHWDQDKMADISQSTFSNVFSWMKIYEFQSVFHWSLSERVKLTIFQDWFSYWFGADQVTSHYLNQWWIIYWRIYLTRPQCVNVCNFPLLCGCLNQSMPVNTHSISRNWTWLCNNLLVCIFLIWRLCCHTMITA